MQEKIVGLKFVKDNFLNNLIIYNGERVMVFTFTPVISNRVAINVCKFNEDNNIQNKLQAIWIKTAIKVINYRLIRNFNHNNSTEYPSWFVDYMMYIIPALLSIHEILSA